MGYSDDKVRAACRDAIADGWTHFKVKVGADPRDDARRVGLVREAIGPTRTLMVDANQRWEVGEAIARMQDLARFTPLWIEEPTSPDDVLGNAAIARALAPVEVATGEHAHNRVMFKQLLQARAISFCQIDSCRLGGVNENLAVMLMAAKFGVPVCPHAGGVGLCELVQHLSMFDFIAITGRWRIASRSSWTTCTSTSRSGRDRWARTWPRAAGHCTEIGGVTRSLPISGWACVDRLNNPGETFVGRASTRDGLS
jgi:L-fuconate dehydratase